jgi:hypothetical protein
MSTTNLNRKKLLLLFFEEGDDDAILKICKDTMDNYFLIYSTFSILRDCGFNVEDIKHISISEDCITLLTYGKKMAKKVADFDGHPCIIYKPYEEEFNVKTSLAINREDNVLQIKCV